MIWASLRVSVVGGGRRVEAELFAIDLAERVTRLVGLG
jgi:hypothetical protein